MLTLILLGTVLALLIVLTVCGNVLVCLAVCTTRRLRCVTNCFIVSLAVTDLLLGALVLPFSALLEVRQGAWPLGAAFCNVYVSLDVMLSTASILNLLAISMDRYLAVTAPLRYAALLRPARVGVALALIWLVSVCLSFVPIHMGWNTRDGTVQNVGAADDDDADAASAGTCKFDLNATYAVVDALFTFYLPLLAMCWSYCRVFRIARAQARRIVATRRAGGCSSTPAGHWGVLAVAVRENKATVTLAAVVGAFIVCWTPYFTYFTVMGLLQKDMRDTAYSVVLWLGYTNSALNPFLYAALNRDFRSAYGRLLYCPRLKPVQLDSNVGAGEGRSWEDGPVTGLKHCFSRAGSVPGAMVMMQDLNGSDGPPLGNGNPLMMDTEVTDGNNTLSLTPGHWTRSTSSPGHPEGDTKQDKCLRWLAEPPQGQRG
ncbi:histamine receptor H2a isoform X2 [Alosa pseudoharengus]|uniref:histamine receptor H2a isoform X2 n=1 Tax=Alosa pseudoharengus TaxID=34774 RepID=UPI003F8930C5